jgi:FlaA1/EpsC-like NDP-sugar epimerase
LINQILSISRINKQLLIILIDSIILILVLLLSFSVRLGYGFFPENELMYLILGSPIIAIPIFIWFDLYKEILRYIGLNMIWLIFKAISLYSLLWGILAFMLAIEDLPRSVILINWLFVFVFITGLRMGSRWLISNSLRLKNLNSKNVVIYGAGSAGRELSIAFKHINDYNHVAFVDDEIDIQKHSIGGIKVISPADLKVLIVKNKIDEVLLAMPSVAKSRRREILDFLQQFPVYVRSIPSLSELAEGKVKVADLQDVSIKDLLGRDSVTPNYELLSLNIENKVVMVTGAGGSIGSELCRQIFSLKPSMLILFEMSEIALYSIEKELLSLTSPQIKVYPLLGSVNNRSRLNQIIKKYNVQTIYHAAAYKHVPMVEYNNSEGVNNNIFGTLNCALAAIDANVNTFVLISTDKAVRPTNTMGASKRFSEMILQALSLEQSSTQFSIVRFGNVLGSSGSVIPLFRKQIKNGGPLTITDPKMIRYFMTIPEAVELVIQAGSMGHGGDVFVLDMGNPVRILDLAKKMIHLSGLDIKNDSNPNGDIEIIYTGLRPGEKLYEELLIEGNTSKTDHTMIMRAEEKMLAWDELKDILNHLEKATTDSRPDVIRKLLLKAIPEFEPQSEITDLLYD